MSHNKYFYIQAVFATAFSMLTGGVFLSGLALYMNASDIIVSYCSIIPNLCGITILFLSFLLEKFTSKKKLTLWLTLAAKLSACMIIGIPVWVAPKYQMLVFVLIVVISYTLQALSTVALNNWMLHFIPGDSEGRFVSIRQTWSLVVTIVLSLSAGRLMDAAENEYTGFLILYSLGILMAVSELASLSRIKDISVHKKDALFLKKSDFFRVPLKNKIFVHYMVYIFIFYIFLYISDSFTTVYMMKYLQLPYGLVVVYQLLMSLPQVFLLRIWGKISDTYGHKTVLYLSIWFFIGETFFLGVSGRTNYFIFIPLAYFIASAANSGFVISLFNRRYEIVPEDGRMVYDCLYSAVIGLAFILGPLIGDQVRAFTAKHIGPFGMAQFWDIRLLYFISTIGIFLLQFVQCYRFIRNKKSNRPA